MTTETLPLINEVFDWIRYMPWKQLHCMHCHRTELHASNVRDIDYKKFVLLHRYCKGQKIYVWPGG